MGQFCHLEGFKIVCYFIWGSVTSLKISSSSLCIPGFILARFPFVVLLVCLTVLRSSVVVLKHQAGFYKLILSLVVNNFSKI